MIEDRWKIVLSNPRYIVSEFGDVFSLRTGKMLTVHLAGRGYQSVSLSIGGTMTKHVYVHALVAEAFIGPRPKGMEVMHLDSDKTNNYRTNIAYGTPKENAQEKVARGVNRGSRNGRHKIAENDVSAIRFARRSGVSVRELAKQYGLTRSHVCGIVARSQWAWMSD